MDGTTQTSPSGAAQSWKPLGKVDRRVLGVLIEKAKTTPDQYPLSLNALVSGCNQKSNRHPLMNLEPDDVSESLERLRHMGAAAEVQSGGRVSRFRHYAKDWLGIEKAEVAVIAELLLRGPQTEGDLRVRASRMDPLPDLPALRTVLDSLQHKGLVIALTPAGRGQIISHNMFLPEELERQKREFAGYAAGDGTGEEPPASALHSGGSSAAPAEQRRSGGGDTAALWDEIRGLKSELAEIWDLLTQLQNQIQGNAREPD